MDKEKLEKLNRLMELMQEGNLSRQEVSTIIQTLISVVKKTKESFDSLSSDNLNKLNNALITLENTTEKLKQDFSMDTIMGSISEVKEENRQVLQQAVKALEEIKKIKVKDGKDADEDLIVFKVLEQIKLPEYEVFSLEEKGEEIVKEINSLPTTSEYQIDASHIKNLPNQVRYFGGSSGIKEIIAGSNITVDNSNLGYPVISSTGGGSSTFLNLTDTPASYSGQTLKGVRVNAGETALEFYDTAGGTDEKVKYDASDPTAGYVADKIIAGTGISVAEGTGANENKLVITNSDLGSGAVSTHESTYNHSLIATALQSESDTLSSVTGRGASTSTESTFSGGIISNQTKANTSGGYSLKADNGDTIALFGAGGGKNATFYDGVKLDASTGSRILSTDSNKNITALDTTTYPDLTELSYLKGVTSSIQTQLNTKQTSDAQLTSLAGLSYSGNALKVIRVNAGETAFELATPNVLRITTTLSSSQILNSAVSPIEIVGAPGSGKILIPIRAVFSYTYGTTGYTISDTIGVGWTGGDIWLSADALYESSDTISYTMGSDVSQSNIPENTSLSFFAYSPDPTDGDGTLKIILDYSIIDL